MKTTEDFSLYRYIVELRFMEKLNECKWWQFSKRRKAYHWREEKLRDAIKRKRTKGCQCEKIEPQSKACYAQQVVLPIPPHMDDYRRAREENGLSPLISLDPCIVDEIQSLWELGITTYGSCCGHQKYDSFVNVAKDDIPLMLAMGYEQNHPDENRKDTFRLKLSAWHEVQDDKPLRS